MPLILEPGRQKQLHQWLSRPTRDPVSKTNKNNKENHLKGWRDGSVVKSTDCSSRGPEFKSQQHGGSQPYIYMSPKDMSLLSKTILRPAWYTKRRPAKLHDQTLVKKNKEREKVCSFIYTYHLVRIMTLKSCTTHREYPTHFVLPLS